MSSKKNFEPKDLIVYRPEIMSKRQIIGGIATFLLFWAAFLYLFRPVFVTFGWFIFDHIFHSTISIEESFWSEVLKPIHVFMLVVLVTMSVLPFWIAFKESYTAERRNRTRLNIEKIVVPSDFGKIGHNIPKLPIEIIPTTREASKITYHFDNKSSIIGLNLDGEQVAIEYGKAKPIRAITPVVSADEGMYMH